MIEQYIYTRVDGGSAQRDYGHGLAKSTEGVAGDLKSDVSAIARYSNTTVDGEGRRVKVFEKRNLGTGNFAAFQQSVRFAERPAAGDLEDGDERLLYYSSTNRPQFLSHGYVCDIYDEAGTMLDPDRWFALKFVDYNTNLKEPELEALESLPPAITPLEPLPEVLEKAGMTLESFITAVRASFDTENQDTIELIELDFTRPDAQELGGQLLRWIFHFLPFAMRRQADFSSCYDTGCGGHEFAIALIPSAMLEERGGRVTFKGIPSSAKYGYIIADGRVTHQKLSERTDFDTSGSLYSRWLEAVIRRTYDLPVQAGLETLRTLDGIYSAFDGLVRTLPNKKQCETALYDALCWAYLRTGFYRGGHIDDADGQVLEFATRVADSMEVLLSLEDADTLRPLVPDLLDRASQAASQDYDGRFVKLLCLIREKLDDGPETREVLDIWLAKLLDSSDSATLRAALDGYFSVAGEGERIPALERAFFPRALTPRRWELAGISWEREAGESRARLWIRGVVTEKTRWSDYLEQTRQVFETLATFAPENLAAIVDRQLIPPMADGAPGTFRDVGALTVCQDSLRRAFSDDDPVREKLERFYDTICDRLMRGCMEELKELDAAPEEIIRLLGRIREAFEGASGIESGRLLQKDLTEAALKRWLKAAAEQKGAHGEDRITFLEDEPELHKHMATELVWAKKIGADTELIRDAYVATCWFLCTNAFSYRTRNWYINEIEGVMWFRNRLNAVAPSTSAIAAVADFLNSQRKDLPALLTTCGEYRLDSENNALFVLILLLELYDNGELPELESEIPAYYAFCRERRAAPEQQGRAAAKCFERVLEQKGGRGLIKLLNDFPNAEEQIEEEPKEETGRFNIGKLVDLSKKLSKRSEPEEPEEYVRREGLYPWMRTDEELLRALISAVKSCGDLLQDEMKEDEMLCPDLVKAVLDLTPPESTLIELGRKVNTLLSDYWEEIRTGGTPAKKAMNELKKKGAFSQGR